MREPTVENLWSNVEVVDWFDQISIATKEQWIRNHRAIYGDVIVTQQLVEFVLSYAGGGSICQHEAGSGWLADSLRRRCRGSQNVQAYDATGRSFIKFGHVSQEPPSRRTMGRVNILFNPSETALESLVEFRNRKFVLATTNETPRYYHNLVENMTWRHVFASSNSLFVSLPGLDTRWYIM